MRTSAQKSNTTQPITSAKASTVSRAHVGQGHDPNSILNLQRTMGNQAVQRFLNASVEGQMKNSGGASISRFAHDFSNVPALSGRTRLAGKDENETGPVSPRDATSASRTYRSSEAHGPEMTKEKMGRHCFARIYPNPGSTWCSRIDAGRGVPFDFARISILPAPVQRKPIVSSPGDQYEREAGG